MSSYRGYAGDILHVDLSAGDFARARTEDYAERFLGGRGLAATLYWDQVPPRVDAFHPDNRLLFTTGPMACVPGFGGSRWQVSGKSPIHDQFSYCNLGGSWGAQLKYAGYDGLVVHGRAERPVYLLIDGERVEIKDASHLVGMGAIACRERLKEELGKAYSVVTVGPAGENRVVFASLVADQDSTGSSGLGAVMGSKNLKAIAVKGAGRKVEVADRERVRQLKEQVLREWRGRFATYQMVLPQMVNPEKTKKNVCHGCATGCMRLDYKAASGMSGKFMCQAGVFYEIRAQRYYGEINGGPFEATKLCDDYGVDTHAVETMLMWLSRCLKAELLSDETSGMPLTKMGSREFIETFLHRVCHREGFGDVLAEGTHRAAESLGPRAQELITDYMTWTGYNPVYGGRLYVTTALLYAMEPRLPIQQLHEISPLNMMWMMGLAGAEHVYITSDVLRAIGRRFWGSEVAADYSSYEGKALAAAMIQDRQYAKECLVLCDFLWPIFHSQFSDDHVGDPSLESQVLSAVTGMELDEQGLYRIGERVFNLQRAIRAREGHSGRESDCIEEFNFTVPLKGDFGNPECIVPGQDGTPFSRKGMVLEREKFEQMKDEFYQVRGWDVATGLQRRSQLEALDLKEVADTLEGEGLCLPG